MKTGLKDPASADLLPTFLHWTYSPTGVAWGTGRHCSPYFFKKSFLTVRVFKFEHSVVRMYYYQAEDIFGSRTLTLVCQIYNNIFKNRSVGSED